MVTIIVSGTPGSGKSTVAKYLAKKLRLRHVSAGDKVRELAREKNIEFHKFHDYLESHVEVDKRVDEMIKEEAVKGDVVIDGALAGYTVGKVDIKIFLRTPDDVAAQRIAKREGLTMDVALVNIRKRKENNRERWKRIYGIDVNDLKPYNLILDTSLWTIDEMKEIIEFIINKSLIYKGGAETL